MKRVLIATNILLLCIILFLGCDQKASSDPANSFVPTVNDCDTCIYNSYPGTEPAGTVSGRIIKELSVAYADDMNKSRIGGTQDPDALSITFNLEEIKNLIWHIDSAVCKNGCDKTQLGIKFYYIKYDNTVDGLTPDMQEVINANPNKHSLVMVPAYLSGDKWYDFNYRNLAADCKFKSVADSIIGVMNLSGSNHGGIGPPPAPGTFPTIQ